MKRITILLSLIALLAGIANAQSKFPQPESVREYIVVECDTFPNVNEKCIDSKGRRQGYWEFCKEFTYLKPEHDFESGKQEFKKSICVSYGSYLNNNKVGLWCYGLHDSNFWEVGRSNGCMKTVTYFKDSTYVSSWMGDSKIVYNADSSEVHGSAFTRPFVDGYIVQFECFNGKCKFHAKGDSRIIEECDIENLEFFIERFKLGEYNRKMKYNASNAGK